MEHQFVYDFGEVATRQHVTNGLTDKTNTVHGCI
jgi:hypothetical protein